MHCREITTIPPWKEENKKGGERGFVTNTIFLFVVRRMFFIYVTEPKILQTISEKKRFSSFVFQGKNPIKDIFSSS